jgi:fatty acid kinase fatty acid binding subunit
VAGVRVVTDSACDLPAPLAEELGIEIVPLTIRFGDLEFVDRRDLSPAEFWARCADSPLLPETAAPSPGAFESVFQSLADDGADGIVCVNLSAALSATSQAAELAAQKVSDRVPVRVVDSRAVTMAQGLMAVAAARMAAAGKGIEDVAGAVLDMVPRTRIFGALDTLENLKKGGRVGSAQALLGSMLSIKPIIELRDGKVEPESRQRTRSKALAYLADKVRQQGRLEQLAVMHGDAPDIDEFLDSISELYPRDQLIIGEVGAVIGAHSGPRVIGVAFTLPK